MATVERKGILQLRTKNEGSKSEGRYAILLTEEGGEYTLYRQNSMPMDDSYFDVYDGATVTVTGIEEEQYFRVEDIVKN